MKESIKSGIAGGVVGAITGLVAVGAALNYNAKKKETVKVDSQPADFQEEDSVSDNFEEDIED